MRKLSVIAAIAAATVLSANAFAAGTITVGENTFERNTDTWYCVNGKYIDFNSNGIYTDTLVTEVESGSVNLMPIRAFAESIGATLSLEGDTSVWDVIADEYAINLCAGYDFINVYKMDKGNPTFLSTWKLSCPVVEHDGVTYIPFRSAICALFGVDEADSATTDKIAVNQIDGGYAIFANKDGNAEADKKDKSELTRDVTIDGKTLAIAKDLNSINFDKYLKTVLEENKQYYYVVNDEEFKTSLDGVDLSTLSAVVTDEDLRTVSVGTVISEYGKTQFNDKKILKTAKLDSEKYYFGKEITEEGPLKGTIAYNNCAENECTHIIEKTGANPAQFITVTYNGNEYKLAGLIREVRGENKVTCIVKNGTNNISLYDGDEIDKDGNKIEKEQPAEETVEEATTESESTENVSAENTEETTEVAKEEAEATEQTEKTEQTATSEDSIEGAGVTEETPAETTE